MKISEFSTFVFDFDGTLVESARLKTQAFFDVLSEIEGAEEILRRILADSPEFTRSEVLESVLRGLDKDLAGSLDILIDGYGERCRRSVARAPEVEGAELLLEFLYRNEKSLYISSATPEDELNDLVNQRGFSRYVKKAFGAPERKEVHLEEILTIEGHLPRSVLCVGDTVADERIAIEKGCTFLGISRCLDADGFSSLTFVNMNELMTWLRQSPPGWCLGK